MADQHKKQVYVLSGIAGSGKTTEAKRLVALDPHRTAYLSTDSLREAHPDWTDKQVFATFYHLYQQALTLPTIYTIVVDTTALSQKRRIKFKHENALITVVLMFCSLQTSIKRIATRKEDAPNKVPFKALKEQLIALMPPVVGVDCDNFILKGESFFHTEGPNSIIQNPTSLNFLFKTFKETIQTQELAGITEPHHSKYHSETIWEHISETFLNATDEEQRLVALFHDLGKPLARAHNEKTGYDLFKGHENWGSIALLNYLYTLNNTKRVYTSNYTPVLKVLYHMLPFTEIKESTKRTKGITPTLWKSLLAFNDVDKKSSFPEK